MFSITSLRDYVFHRANSTFYITLFSFIQRKYYVFAFILTPKLRYRILYCAAITLTRFPTTPTYPSKISVMLNLFDAVTIALSLLREFHSFVFNSFFTACGRPKFAS